MTTTQASATFLATLTPAAPRTRTQEVLAARGHALYIDRNGCSVVLANPERADRWGCVCEADWADADASERAPLQGPLFARVYPAYTDMEGIEHGPRTVFDPIR